jgi:hypothetical protein
MEVQAYIHSPLAPGLHGVLFKLSGDNFTFTVTFVTCTCLYNMFIRLTNNEKLTRNFSVEMLYRRQTNRYYRSLDLHEQISYSEVELHSFLHSIVTKIESGIETFFVCYCSVTQKYLRCLSDTFWSILSIFLELSVWRLATGWTTEGSKFESR